MGIGIGSSWSEDSEDDRPLVGRHWLEDIDNISSFSHKEITEDEILKALSKMSHNKVIAIFNKYQKNFDKRISKFRKK